MSLDKNYFIRQSFAGQELEKYKRSAKRDLDIAINSDEVEVKFHFVYMALVKIGIYRIALEGYRVKSRPGHHQRIIETLGKLMGSEEINIIGDKMRKDRNMDLYSADDYYSSEEVREYLKFVEQLYAKL